MGPNSRPGPVLACLVRPGLTRTVVAAATASIPSQTSPPRFDTASATATCRDSSSLAGYSIPAQNQSHFVSGLLPLTRPSVGRALGDRESRLHAARLITTTSRWCSSFLSPRGGELAVNGKIITSCVAAAFRGSLNHPLRPVELLILRHGPPRYRPWVTGLTAKPCANR